MQGADALFHVAGWYEVGTRDQSPAWAINVQGTRNVLEVMKELGIPKGVYTSSNVAFGDTGGEIVDESYRPQRPFVSVYDRSKSAADFEVAEPMMEAGLPLVVLHPGIVYGIGDHSMLQAGIELHLQRRLPALPKVAAACFATVQDIAGAHLLALEKGKIGERYIVGGPIHTYLEVFELAARVSGIPLPWLKAEPWMLKANSALMGVLQKLGLRPPAHLTAEGLRVQAGVTYTASDEKARRELGFDPTPLQEGLPPLILHTMQQLGLPLPD
jgi:nucleoside-diphosphate-sugar epimerase